jgi:hypothetical protein
LSVIFGRPNFFGAYGSLFFIQWLQTRLTVRMLTFISMDMVLELMLLVFARIMYLTLAVVSFKTLFVLPLPISPKGLGVYKRQAFRTLQNPEPCGKFIYA